MNAPRLGRTVRCPVDGVLVLDKPVGLSSTAALQRARRLLEALKAGHTGTLDPLASGVLPLCFGAATKLAQAGLDADKRYLATLAFGVTTTTGDREGAIVRDMPTQVSRHALVEACARLTGPIEQLPPMHSALKHDGRPLYAWARAGVEVERAPRRVVVRSIEIVDTAEDAQDRWMIDVACSKGTYIRTLAEAIGDALGCGAHLAALRRTATGTLDVAQATTLDALEALAPIERRALLLPADVLVAGWPRIALDASDAGRFLTGLRRRVAREDAAHVRVYGPPVAFDAANRRVDGPPVTFDAADRRVEGCEPMAFLGIGRIAGGELIAERLLSPDEVARAAPRAPTSFATAP